MKRPLSDNTESDKKDNAQFDKIFNFIYALADSW